MESTSDDETVKVALAQARSRRSQWIIVVVSDEIVSHLEMARRSCQLAARSKETSFIDLYL